MGNGSSRGSGGKSSASCVGEKVQNFNRPPGVFNFFGKPVPVSGLFGKQSCVLEIKGLQVKSQIPVMDGPLLREIEKFPFAAAFFASVIMGVS